MALMGISLAVMCHPFALAAVPMLVLLPWKASRTWLWAVLAGALAMPQLVPLVAQLGGWGGGGSATAGQVAAAAEG